MRKSEALSLEWRDVDFDLGLLSIGKTLTIDEHGSKLIQNPKTKNSTRQLSLDAETLHQLRKWRIVQQEELFLLGYNTNKKKQLIFTTNCNELYYPQVANDWLNWVYKKYDCMDVANKKRMKKEQATLLRELEDPFITQKERFEKQAIFAEKERTLMKEHVPLKRITVHGFRYTHCSLLFESGASIKEVQARLGHKDVQTTMNIYACVTPQMIEDTGEKFAQYMSF